MNKNGRWLVSNGKSGVRMMKEGGGGAGVRGDPLGWYLAASPFKKLDCAHMHEKSGCHDSSRKAPPPPPPPPPAT